MRMVKVKRDWLINQVETVKTLSLNSYLRGLPWGDPNLSEAASLHLGGEQAAFAPALGGQCRNEGKRTELPFLSAASARVSVAGAVTAAAAVAWVSNPVSPDHR